MYVCYNDGNSRGGFMKKVLKNISRVLFSLLLIVSIFGTFNVLAEEVIFKIINISVKEKSNGVTVNDVSLSGGSIVNDIVFTDKDDYITYNITFKNNTSDKYKILSITDDNDSEYLDYTYDDLSNTELNGGDEKTFNLTITYKQETNNLTISDKAVSLTLTYEKEDGTTGTETITNPDNNTTTGEVKGATENITNPKTGDNVTIYIILGIISLVGLVVTTVSKKHLSKSLMTIALVSSIILPLGVRADSDKFIIKFNNNITKVAPPYTILSGDINTRGSIIDIAGERFELIKNYGNKVTMLAVNPLNVGPNQIDNDKKGLQDDLSTGNYYSGKIAFSDSTYWLEGGNLKDDYASSNYVYDENSNLYQYVEDYVAYLKDKNPNIIKGRLWSQEESSIYNCSYSERMCYVPSAIDSRDGFWTGIPISNNGRLIGTSFGRYDWYNYNDNPLYLVPVIEMSID